MKSCKFKILLLVLTLVYFPLVCQSAAKEKYDKHVIIVVDQTATSNINMRPVYEKLCKLLLNQDTGLDKSLYDLPDDFHFDPNTDEISVLGFALPRNEYDAIHNRQTHTEANILFEEFSNSLIKDACSFQKSTKSLDDFLKDNLLEYFTGNTPLSRSWHTHPNGLTFSHYVFPVVLKHIDATIPSSQFLLFIISDFQCGAYGEGDIRDERNLSDLMGKKYSSVVSLINTLGSPFVRSNYIDYRIGDSQTNINNLRAIRLMGYKLLMKKTVQKSPIFITSGVSPIEQIKHEGEKYRISPTTIQFNKDDNTFVTKVCLKISSPENSTKVFFDGIVADSLEINSSFDERLRTFTIDHSGMELDLASAFPQPLNFEYTFYTVSKDDAGNNIMPYILTATRNITEKDFDMNGGYLMTFLIVGIILLIVGVVLYFVWMHRGKVRNANLKYRIDRVSKMHYMDVKDDEKEGLHALNYDCWYINEGETETNIHIRGDVSLLSKAFAKDYRLRLAYMIKDLDQNYDFTFRPGGKDHNGENRKEGQYYYKNLDENGHFEFDAVVYIDTDDDGNVKSPEFYEKDNILEMGLYLQVELIDNAGNVLRLLAEENNEKNPYKFIVKPNIQNRDLWMAFDPGTSGSCVAYGFGGTPDDMTNIHLAKNFVKDEGWNPIIPSYITINDSDTTLNKLSAGLEYLESPADYEFGNAAYQQEYHLNRFQSIKKLLGYTKTKQKIYSDSGKEKEIDGCDLAHLIIKGLMSNFERFLRENTEDATKSIKPLFMPHGLLQPSRAIVAVPNNYTLTKVRDMVDSIRRTNQFKEVHYLYEAEGVMMSYLRMNWKDLKNRQKKTFIVFDMGGATINVTAFRIKVNQEITSKGNTFTRDIDVNTVSKIGYCVGGDDIDYAIMQVLYHIPQVRKAFNNKNEDIKKHQVLYKPSILKYVEELKLALIDREHAQMKSGNMFISKETLWSSVTTKFAEWGIEITTETNEDGDVIVPNDFWNYIQQELKEHKTLKYYVFDKVKDAVMELMNNTILNSDIELIFSGRSTLYPGIEEAVLEEIRNSKYHCSCDDRWHGFDKTGTIVLDADKVKTAVVEGACWYALWSGRINMKHDLVTSTFGYIDMVNDQATFIPVVKKNMSFAQNGKKKVIVDVKDPELKNVKFIQMLGTNYSEIIENDIKHKKNLLVEVTANDINGVLEKVQIEVDDKNNFAYKLIIAGHAPLTGHYEAADTDILDENSEVYAFASVRSKNRPEISHISQRKQHKKTTQKGGGL